MEPNIQIHYLAVGLAVLASFLVGFIWYSFLFSKSWQKEMGYTEKMDIDKITFNQCDRNVFNGLGFGT